MEVTTPDRFAESDARGLVRAFCAVVALVASGCAVGIVGEQSADKMQCRVPVLKCPPVPSPLTISTLQPTPAPGSSCYQQQAGSISGAQLYCDPGNFTVLGSSDPGLAGASLVQTRQADSGSTAAQHFVFRPTPVSGTSPLGELFVAYDSRATVAPAWLSADFVPVVNPLDGSNHTLRTTFPDRTAGAPAGQTVDLDLYKRRVATAAELAIPGNSAGNPQFPAGLTVADRAMYVVLLKPRTRPGPCGVNAHSLHVAEDCYAVPRVGGAFDLAFISQMQTKAVASCNEVFSQLPAFQCAVPQAECLRIGSCPADQAKTSPLSVPANRFLRHSEVVFEPATSLARVQVQGRHYVRAVSGRLHFEPEFDAGQLLQKLSVRSIALSIGSIGGFEDLSLVLGSPFDAACADSPPLVASPCDRYRIAPGAMEAELGARQDGQWTVASGTNLAMSILVDHTQRSFRLRGGPVRAAVEVDGDPATVELLVDLTGRFENFAPVADTRESKAHSECVEGRNRDPIVLDAAGSFDIYASLPPTAYEWWEDYAQLGERFLGAGSRVTLWPRHLDFGLHHMTLAVEDSAGVVSTDSLIVQVLDSEPPFMPHLPPCTRWRRPERRFESTSARPRRPIPAATGCSCVTTGRPTLASRLDFRPWSGLLTTRTATHRLPRRRSTCSRYPSRRPGRSSRDCGSKFGRRSPMSRTAVPSRPADRSSRGRRSSCSGWSRSPRLWSRVGCRSWGPSPSRSRWPLTPFRAMKTLEPISYSIAAPPPSTPC